MKIIPTIAELRNLQASWRLNKKCIALVPTMGNLHEGHLALVRQAQQHADHVVVSIFVNPLQFGPKEDFASYPRTADADVQKLQSLKVDVVFMPQLNEIYPGNAMPATCVGIPGISDDLCGITRPQMFYGVTTLLSKLFHIVQADIAVFGEKDFQQLVIVKQMVNDLNFPLQIISGKTVREPDGLAMSSRNSYLTPPQRQIAPQLYATLCKMRDYILAGNHDYDALANQAKQRLEACGFGPIDYIAVRDRQTLQNPTAGSELIVLAAAFLGKTRLIDNVLLDG